MRNFVAAALCVRYKKPLLISVLGFVVVAVLYSWVILDSSFLTYSGSKLPKLSEWLGSGQAGMAGEKSDGKLSADASFSARQQLGSDIQRLFVDYEPSADAVNQTFLEKWPTMVGFQLDKKFNYDEVANASTNFFVDDEASESFKKQQQELMNAIPSWASVSKAFSGRGVVICAGSYDLSRIWPNVALMMRSLGSSLPIEVWTKDEEEYSRTLPMANQLRTELGMTISVHALSDYMSIVWAFVSVTEIYKVKALSLLLSSFEEAILFDSDSVPVMDPEVLFDSEEGKSGLIQWPDFWTNSLSKVMHDAYDVDYSFTRTCESGQVMIDKKKQFEPLVMTSYFNWWGPTFFYKLINLDGMGAGDKDTFWVGSAVYHRDYHVVGRALELITAKKHNGSLWKEAGGVFNGAMGQFNPINTSEIFTMHLHAPKINLQAAELYGQYDLQFFLPEEKQNVSYAKGALWLETHLWENLQWVECESVHRNLTSNACEGVKERVISLREALGE